MAPNVSDLSQILAAIEKMDHKLDDLREAISGHAQQLTALETHQKNAHHLAEQQDARVRSIEIAQAVESGRRTSLTLVIGAVSAILVSIVVAFLSRGLGLK